MVMLLGPFHGKSHGIMVVVVMGDIFLTNKNDGITGISWDKCGTPNNKPTIFGGVFFFCHP